MNPGISESSSTIPSSSSTTSTTRIIKAVLFDLDGTLLDTESLSDKALLHALFPPPSHDLKQQQQQQQEEDSSLPTLHSLHNPLGEERLPWELKKQILGLRGAEWAPIVLNYYKNQLTQQQQQNYIFPSEQDLWNAWEDNLNRYCCTEVQVCPGAVEVVQQFHDLQLPMAIATSSRRDNVTNKRSLPQHEDNIFGKMQTIVTGEDVLHGKPAPDIYLEAAKRLQVDPTHCLVFEDALSGVRAGKAAGCYVVAIPDPRFSTQERAVFEQEANLVLHSLHEFRVEELQSLGLQFQK